MTISTLVLNLLLISTLMNILISTLISTQMNMIISTQMNMMVKRCVEKAINLRGSMPLYQ